MLKGNVTSPEGPPGRCDITSDLTPPVLTAAHKTDRDIVERFLLLIINDLN